MASLAILTGMLLLAALVLVTWRARALSVAAARRLEAEAIRGRELDAVAEDAANLLCAAMSSLEHARATLQSSPKRAGESLDEGLVAAKALAGLLDISRAHDGRSPMPSHRADACIRLAVAVLRSRGAGVQVLGDGTELAVRGDSRAASALLIELLESASASLAGRSHLVVELDQGGIAIGAGRGMALEGFAARAREHGWELEANDDHVRVMRSTRIEPATGLPSSVQAREM